MARLLFALWPPDAARVALAREAAQLANRCGGRAMAESRIHLTLAFLGDVPESRLADVMAVAEAVSSAAFSTCFDQVGSFSRSEVAWARPSRAPEALLRLAADLDSRLRESGFALEKRPFAPHVTLVRRILRKVDRAPLEPIAWETRAFALVESGLSAGRYETRGMWKLGAR